MNALPRPCGYEQVVSSLKRLVSRNRMSGHPNPSDLGRLAFEFSQDEPRRVGWYAHDLLYPPPWGFGEEGPDIAEAVGC